MKIGAQLREGGVDAPRSEAVERDLSLLALGPGDTPVGYTLAGAETNARVAHSAGLGVLPAWRRRGIGAALVRATEGLTRVLAGRAATHPQALTARANLAALLTRAGRADEAATRLTEILRDAETTHLDPHALAELRLTLADTLLATGDCDQARAAAAAAAAPLRADDPLRARAEALLSAQGPQRCR